MNEAYLTGRGLASALGPDLDEALATLGRGDVPPTPFALADGSVWSYQTLDDAYPIATAHESAWAARTRPIVQRVAAASGALAGARTGPLFVASSSMDIGLLESTGHLLGDYHDFADAVAGWLDWRGHVFTVSTACTSGIN